MQISKMTRFALALLVAAQLAMAVVAEAELEIEILTPSKEGCRGAKAGDNLKIHYDGKLSDGTRFDSSYERNQPLAVALGKQMVIVSDL
jgi:FKBP-type peptidyl-prolyl cis-trans isomerase